MLDIIGMPWLSPVDTEPGGTGSWAWLTICLHEELNPVGARPDLESKTQTKAGLMLQLEEAMLVLL